MRPTYVEILARVFDQCSDAINAVNGNLTVDIEATTVPTRAELDERVFDDYPWG